MRFVGYRMNKPIFLLNQLNTFKMKKVFIIFDESIEKSEMERIVAYFGLRNTQFYNSTSLLLDLQIDITEIDVDQIIKICSTHMYIVQCDTTKLEESPCNYATIFNVL